MIGFQILDVMLDLGDITLQAVGTLDEIVMLVHLLLETFNAVGGQFVGGNDAAESSSQRAAERKQCDDDRVVQWTHPFTSLLLSGR